MTLEDQPPTSLDAQHHGSLDSNAPTTVAAAESRRGSQDAPQNEKQQIAQADPNAPTGLKFALILVALYAAVFLVALVSSFKLVLQNAHNALQHCTCHSLSDTIFFFLQ